MNKAFGGFIIAATAFTFGCCSRDFKDGYKVFEKNGVSYIQSSYTLEIEPLQGMQIGTNAYALEQMKKNVKGKRITREFYEQVHSLELMTRQQWLEGKYGAQGSPDPSTLSYSFKETPSGVEPYVVSGTQECVLRSVGGLPQLGNLDYRVAGVKQEIREKLEARIKNTFQDVSKALEHGSASALDGLDKLKQLTDDK